MKAFMDQDFILETETAKKLFHEYSEKLPLVDYLKGRSKAKVPGVVFFEFVK